MASLRELLSKLNLFGEQSVDYTKIGIGGAAPAPTATPQNQPGLLSGWLKKSHDAASKRDSVLGRLGSALDQKDITVTLEALTTLVQKFDNDPQILEPVRTALSQMLDWVSPDVFIEATDILIDESDNEALEKIADEFSLHILQQQEQQDAFYAMGIYANILENGDASPLLTEKTLAGIGRLVQKAAPLETPEFLEDLFRAHTGLESGSAEERAIEDHIVFLGDLAQQANPRLAAKAYSFVLEKTDEDDSRNTPLGHKIALVGRKIVNTDAEFGVELLDLAITNLPENDPAAKEAQSVIDAVTKETDPAIYESAAPLSAQAFVLKYTKPLGPG